MRTAILLTVVLLLASLFMLSCDYTPTVYTEQWTITGTVEITATSTLAADVKLACYYTGSEADFSAAASRTLVSNVENLGNTAGVSQSFTLNVNSSSLIPILGDRIYLIMWEDTDGDDTYDAVENWANAEPQPGCPVFQTATLCHFIYDSGTGNYTGTSTGWNQSTGFGTYTPIDQAVKTGALIINIPDL